MTVVIFKLVDKCYVTFKEEETMNFKIDFDPCTKRWVCCLPDEVGKPRIEADTSELLEQFMCDVQAGIFHREKKEPEVQKLSKGKR